ncbi:MAG: HaeIII family restriction endonuclease [Cytophagales bacterium]
MDSGKAFEYALLKEFEEKLQQKTHLQIIQNSSFFVAKDCFESFDETQKSSYLLTASFAVNFLIDIEPRLSHGFDANDVLQLEILQDSKGQEGDVRDVLAIRLLQKWEIGISAKNNHHAVKHSRLSKNIDFGKKWLGIESSKTYFDEISPIFDNLRDLRLESNATQTWSSLGDYHSLVYKPILDAFIKELNRLYEGNPEKVAHNLVRYLVGNKDFYKVIKCRGGLEIEAFNLYGTLNLPFKDVKPKFITPKIDLPTVITDISYKQESKNTVIISLDNGWKLSFRIHNASSRIEASLKFDINLIGAPHSLITNKLSIENNHEVLQ